MRRAARRDENQGEIEQAFRQAGCSVLDLSRVGGGCPDLLVARAGVSVLVEVKTATGALRQSQECFLRDWRGRAEVVRSVDDVLDVLERMV